MHEAIAGFGGAGFGTKPIFKALSPSEFITGSALTTLAGASALGTAMPEIDTTPWLVFRENNKVYVMPQKPLRHSASYRTMQSANLLFGKNVTIQGGVWKLRTFTGLDNTTSEWMRFIAGMMPGGNPPIRWANLTYNDLGMGDLNTSGNGVTVYIQETFNQFQFYVRGNKNNYASLSSNNMDNTFASSGWRPLLEWVSGAQPWV